MLVIGNNLQSNKDELLGNNGVQQAPSTPKGEELEAESLKTKSKKPGAKALRTQGAKLASERCSKGRNNIRKWHKGLKGISCHNKRIYVPGAGDACTEVLK